MASNGAVPPPIPEVSTDLKFDGGVKISWAPVKRRIVNSLKTQGLLGYTDGTVHKPVPIITVSPPSTTPSPDPNTPIPTSQTHPESTRSTAIFSLTPSLEEWIFRNDRAKGIIESHVDDLPSLMPEVDIKTAKEVLDTLENEFAKKDGMRKDAIEAGNSITDSQFRDIVIAAFPTNAFDNIIQNITANASLYSTTASVIQQISFQYSRVENRPNAVVAGDCISQTHKEDRSTGFGTQHDFKVALSFIWVDGKQDKARAEIISRLLEASKLQLTSHILRISSPSSVVMLLLPPSLLCSLSVSVLIFPIILGVLAMPLASHDDGLSTIPQLKLHDNPILTRTLNLRRYDMHDAPVNDMSNRSYKGLKLLNDWEKWVLVWGTKHCFEAEAHGNVWNIQGTDINELMPSGTLLGHVTFRSDDEQKGFDAIAKLPSQPNQFLALQKVIEYLLGKYPVFHLPVPQDIQYQIYDKKWCQIFSAMFNPIYETQWPIRKTVPSKYETISRKF
ncbi:hypothetical protein EV359DRAFT_86589 [Lentinula novae-zelandiae]|nr:hypothetical protein EV359DRAFT_86589 [Lentinula novae-zelandiae]